MTDQQDEPLAEGGAATLGGPKDDAGTAPSGETLRSVSSTWQTSLTAS
ncbi:hypothetical protein AB0K27_14780 [Micromonospora echinospora]|uniref:ABC transporter permease n=1 Tax=Micromonospora echinospora TaxID=1877 RepID=A0ABR6MD72_MICEC|nr:hypothetical protein [Micromonospora echinospora]MBB5113325.1 hypothetical protein [Micromonospora echinospora]